MFPIVDLRYVLTRFKIEKMSSLSAFMAYHLFYFTYKQDSISWHILQFFNDIAHNNCVVIFKSNKLDNNFNRDTHLLMPMPLLLIKKKGAILQLAGY